MIYASLSVARSSQRHRYMHCNLLSDNFVQNTLKDHSTVGLWAKVTVISYLTIHVYDHINIYYFQALFQSVKVAALNCKHMGTQLF